MLKKPLFLSMGLTASTSVALDSRRGRMNFDPDEAFRDAMSGWSVGGSSCCCCCRFSILLWKLLEPNSVVWEWSTTKGRPSAILGGYVCTKESNERLGNKLDGFGRLGGQPPNEGGRLGRRCVVSQERDSLRHGAGLADRMRAVGIWSLERAVTSLYTERRYHGSDRPKGVALFPTVGRGGNCDEAQRAAFDKFVD